MMKRRKKKSFLSLRGISQCFDEIAYRTLSLADQRQSVQCVIANSGNESIPQANGHNPGKTVLGGAYSSRDSVVYSSESGQVGEYTTQIPHNERDRWF
jgi:hypothetical protein